MHTVLEILGIAFLAVLVVVGGIMFYHSMTKIVKEAESDDKQE